MERNPITIIIIIIIIHEFLYRNKPISMAGILLSLGSCAKEKELKERFKGGGGVKVRRTSSTITK